MSEPFRRENVNAFSRLKACAKNFYYFLGKHPFLKDLSFCFLSVYLLVLSFPKYDFWPCAWGALIPFMCALDRKSWKTSLGFGYLVGILFFLGTLYWFMHVTVIGALVLIFYFAVYFGLFALGYNFFSKEKVIWKIFLFPSLWATLEFIRAHLFTGFDWVSLGHSQYKNLLFIQIADVTGMFGVSFILVMINVVLKETVRIIHPYNFKKTNLYPLVIVGGILFISMGYGAYQLFVRSPHSKNSTSVNVAVIQGNIPQEMKWQRSSWPMIMKRYLRLTQKAAEKNPDLIIWPETAFPGFLWEDIELFESLKDFVELHKVPLLLGVVTCLKDNYYNSAILISHKGEMLQQYNKLHLVPFGEYIPFRRYCPFLARLVPIDDFTSGKEYTLFKRIFEDGHGQLQGMFFSVLICFEDTISKISREFVSRGTNLLINITNDAWFQDTSAPFMHLQDAVFRTVETRTSLIRAANTGVSCFVDQYGRILNFVEDKQGKKTYVTGYAIQRVNLAREQTFYVRCGDIFIYLCFGCLLLGIIGQKK